MGTAPGEQSLRLSGGRDKGEQMTRLMMFLFCTLALSSFVYADCTCECVNGEVEPICSNALEVPPVCAPRVCPIVTPSVQPITPPTVPPVGTSQCEEKQVYNDDTGEYEWKLVCEDDNPWVNDHLLK